MEQNPGQNQIQATTQPQQRQLQQSGLAIASLVCGVLSVFFVITCLPAVITGHMALSELKKYPEKYDQSNRGMAIAGLIMGYIILGFTLLFIFFIMIVVIFGVSNMH